MSSTRSSSGTDRTPPRGPLVGGYRGEPCRPGSARAGRSRPRSRDRRRSLGFSRGSIAICARLSIWNTPTVSARRIMLVGFRIVLRDRSQVVARCSCALCRSSKDRRMQPSMPRPSTSTFMNLRISMSFLSHSMTCRFSMAAGSIGTRSSSRSCVRTKPPGCCERWRGAPIRSRESSRVRRRRGSSRLRFRSLRSLVADTLRAPAPHEAGQSARHILRHSQRLADFAHRAAGAVADHDGGERGPCAAIGVVDPLDDLLAPLVLEVDIDIGRLVALLGDEALEEKFGMDRVDGGDAEHVADGGVGCRASPLAENALRSRAKFTMEWTVRKYGA